MQTITLATQLILAGGAFCVVTHLLKREWLKAASWLCVTVYTVFDRVIPPKTSPPIIINSVLVILLVLVAYQIFNRKKNLFNEMKAWRA
ncbi:hypothetical protein [Collimonas pratensis]|uniref:Putative membrane protein n=1 Tax=Collimonas pratensis TaxID=279113 RepID=A0A127Q1R6_9BURK|nr:hypothetical protein [Collimonas pratensis]AMP03964.1 putative membrane protein [Collimonas pratensis]